MAGNARKMVQGDPAPVANWVWDPATDRWIPSQAAAGGATSVSILGQPIDVNITGPSPLDVSVVSQEADYFIDVARGLITGASNVFVMGHNDDVDIGTTPEDLWEPGGLYPFLAAASALEIVSSDAGDTALGAGARTVVVDTLSAALVPQSQVVTLDGVTPVALTGTHLRVNRMEVASVGGGATGTNIGLITLRVPGPGVSQAVIGVGDGRAHHGIYTVPAGFSLYPSNFLFSIIRTATGSEVAEISFRGRSLATADAPWVVRNLFPVSVQGTTGLHLSPGVYVRIPAMTDLRFTASFVSANNTQLTATMLGVLLAD